MSLYAIADLHLSFSDPKKSMDIFRGWEGYTQRLQKNWCDIVDENDIVVAAGDISWAMRLDDAERDFEFLDSLPGTKIILKGNHDYWWATRAKMEKFISDRGFDTIKILHNNHFDYDDKISLCGTRGWIYMPGEESDEKVQAREAARLEASLKPAAESGREPIVFLHYPPVYADNINEDIMNVLYKYNIKRCFYGHIHGSSGHRNAFQGDFNGIKMTMVSSDYLQFFPYRIL